MGSQSMNQQVNAPSPLDREHAASGLERIVETDLFRNTVITLIIVNAIKPRFIDIS